MSRESFRNGNGCGRRTGNCVCGCKNLKSVYTYKNVEKKKTVKSEKPNERVKMKTIKKNNNKYGTKRYEKTQTATMPTNVTGMGTLAGGVSGVPATAMPGGLQSAGMASIELGKKRMRDSNDDLLMVPPLMHGVHFPFFVAGLW